MGDARAVRGAEGVGARRVLVLSGDVLPFAGLPTSGAGLRAWGIAHGLASAGHAVTLLMPERVLEPLTLDASSRAALRQWTYDPADTDDAIARWQPDVIVVQHWWLATHLDPGSIPLVIDLHGPLLLETLYQSHADYEHLARQKIAALARSDFVTCAGELQQHYFYPWLMLAGFDLREPSIAAIPVSLSPDLPPHDPAGETTFVYGGIYLPWQNPLLALRTLVGRLEERGQGRLAFYGGPHPVLQLAATEYEQFERQIAASSRVVAHGLVPHATLLAAYRQAHVAFDVMARNPERELAFTTRTVEYLWCGLPVVYNNYAELARLIDRYEAGWTVDPADASAIAAVVDQVLDDPAEVVRRGQNAQRLAREQLAWDATIGPLDRFCRTPRKRRPRASDLRALGVRSPAHQPTERVPDDLAIVIDQIEALAQQAVVTSDALAQRVVQDRSPVTSPARRGKALVKRLLRVDDRLWLPDHAARLAGDLTQGVVHAQTFRATADLLYGVDILFATYGRVNRSHITVQLQSVTPMEVGPTLMTQTLSAAMLRDNRFHSVIFPPIAVAAGDSLILCLESPDASPTDAVGLWQTASDDVADGQRSVNGVPALGRLVIRVRERQSRPVGQSRLPRQPEADR
jgi:glycosyltransferase involved in cell wall biosynthesis